MSRCPAIGCTCSVPSHRFMCPAHWHHLPARLQREINAGWRRARNAHDLLRDADYVRACAAAIDHLAEREQRANTDNPYRRLLAVLEAKAS